MLPNLIYRVQDFLALHTKLLSGMLSNSLKELHWPHSSASTACQVGQICILLSAQNRISVLLWLPWQCSLPKVDSQPKHSQLTSLLLPVVESNSPSSSELRKGIHAMPRKDTSCMMHQCCLLLTEIFVLHVAVHVHQQTRSSMPNTQRAGLFCRLKSFRTSRAPGSSAKLRRNVSHERLGSDCLRRRALQSPAHVHRDPNAVPAQQTIQSRHQSTHAHWLAVVS